MEWRLNAGLGRWLATSGRRETSLVVEGSGWK